MSFRKKKLVKNRIIVNELEESTCKKKNTMFKKRRCIEKRENSTKTRMSNIKNVGSKNSYVVRCY